MRYIKKKQAGALPNGTEMLNGKREQTGPKIDSGSGSGEHVAEPARKHSPRMVWYGVTPIFSEAPGLEAKLYSFTQKNLAWDTNGKVQPDDLYNEKCCGTQQ